jgi:hypothetical protein
MGVRDMAGVRPYGPAIHEAIADGDLDRMREVHEQARKYPELAEQVELLEAEIAKAESAPE